VPDTEDFWAAEQVCDTSRVTSTRLVDVTSLTGLLPQLRDQYSGADPFPHIVLDDVLSSPAFQGAVGEFPPLRDPSWNGYLHVNETKYANTDPSSWGPVLNGIANEFMSDEFVDFLSRLTGIENLLPDPSMDGGGLHETLRGGHLNIHADFTTHHTRLNWRRRVNILLYFNTEWQPEWGGQLELWNADMTQCRAKVEPGPNRMLIFSTSVDSFHGHPDALRCPEDVARRSMALYYFTEESKPVRRATNYRARPDDGWKRVAIWADRRALDVYDRLKRRLRLSDDRVSSILKRVNRVRRRR